MALNMGQIDLNSEAIPFDRENDGVGVNPSNIVDVGVSDFETLSGDPVGGDEAVDYHKMVFDPGDGRGVNGSLNAIGSINGDCDVMMTNDSEKEGFGEESELVGLGSGLEEGVGIGDGGVSARVENNDEKSRVECSDVILFDDGGAEPEGGLVIEFDSGFCEMECENVGDNAAREGDNDATVCWHEEVKNDLKQLVSQVDAQVDVMQNQTMVVDVSEALYENVQNWGHGFGLVVDLNSYRSTHENLNFFLSDLVWGKVTGHPWWPGQIFDASAASEKAKRHLKEGCYLVAYFGDQTFAWNDMSMIKPFHTHFSQMEKQSNSETFHHAVDCALDEVARRVEFGLSCPCIPEELFYKLKTQVISNAGINDQLSRRNGGDRFINARSFEPMKLVDYVKSLALSPVVESDRLDFVVACSQLLAFYRSKGYFQLSKFPVLGGLVDNDMETLLTRGKEQCDHQTYVDYSQQDPKHICRDSKRHGRKHKFLSDLMCAKGICISNGRSTSAQEAKSVPRRRGRKRKTPYNTSEDDFHDHQQIRLTQFQCASTNDMQSQLCLAAKDPTGESCFVDMVHFFTEFRKFISHDYSASLDQEMSLELMHDGETGITSTAALASLTSTMEPCNDSYWTDRIIQSIPEQSLTEYKNERAIVLPETLTEANPLSFKFSPSAEITTDFGFKMQDTDIHPTYSGSESSKLVEQLDESSIEGFCPTALTLKFTNLDSVPSTTDLNQIFGRYGPLMESKTELLERTNRARVVFLRRADAETAFSSAGKYSIFGPSLVSYRLKILPRKLKGTGKQGRTKRKETASVDGTMAPQFDASVFQP